MLHAGEGAEHESITLSLYELGCLPPSGDVPSTKLFLATALGSAPKNDGTDTWPVAPELLSTCCNQAVFTSLITQIRQASDIMSDGTQDPRKTCDGISIGIGFDATQAQRGAVGQALPTAQSCP